MFESVAPVEDERPRPRRTGPAAAAAGVAIGAALLLASGLGSADARSRVEAEGAPHEGASFRWPADSACAVVLSTNDEHGGLLPAQYPWTGDGPAGGAESVAAYVDRVRETSACPVFLFSGGDLMQGTLISNLTEGRATIEAMNEIGYDAAAIGNHEFDWGVRTLQQRMQQARFPILGANIYERGTGLHPPWVQPYAVVERDGVRIGVIGTTTRSTPDTTQPDSVAGLEFRSIAEALDLYIPRVRVEGVDFVVVILHAGGFCNEANAPPAVGAGGESADAGVRAAATESRVAGRPACAGEAMDELGQTQARFDYAVTGHTHSRVDDVIQGAPIVQSWANMAGIGQGQLVRHPSGEVEAELVEIVPLPADTTAADPELAALVGRYEKEADRVAREPVATLGAPLERAYRGTSTLGRLIADAQREVTDAQIAIMNNGGIRMDLPAGPVSYGQLYRVQPFQNRLIRLRLQGSLLLAALESSLDEDGIEANISGLTVEYDPEAAGVRVRCVRLPDGRPVQRDSAYSVTVNDFMAAGGAGFWMFKQAEAAEPTGLVDLDALVTYLRSRPQPVEPPEDPRWIAVSGGAEGCG